MTASTPTATTMEVDIEPIILDSVKKLKARPFAAVVACFILTLLDFLLEWSWLTCRVYRALGSD